MRHTTLLLFILLTATASYGQMYLLQYIDIKTDASFRGMSVAQDGTVWVTGSKGWVGRITDSGNYRRFHRLQDYEDCDFRTVYAFDANHAIIANAGSPAYVLYTADGGYTWKEVYTNTDSAAFIDGVDFWNKKAGLIHGDPINGRMLCSIQKTAAAHGKNANKNTGQKWWRAKPLLPQAVQQSVAPCTVLWW